MALAFGGLMFVIVVLFGALAGRFGGWLAERRGRDGVADPRSRT
jgi:ABC-type dipeptide/oligopeptide/nickel transport system permease subunit